MVSNFYEIFMNSFFLQMNRNKMGFYNKNKHTWLSAIFNDLAMKSKNMCLHSTKITQAFHGSA